MRWAWMGVMAPLALVVGCVDQLECDCIGIGVGPFDGSTLGEAGAPSAQPMLVRAQTGKTVQSTPGDGVGVFVDYAAGGHWTIWWTCDTNKTGRTCTFDVNATTHDGTISNVAGYDGTTLTASEGGAPEGGAFDGGASDAGSPAFPIRGSVTNEIQGVTFDTAPGAVLEVTASLDGSYNGSLFYFIDGNKVNDGYKGQLTDPLEFEPTSP